MKLMNVGRECSCGTSVRMEDTETKKICPNCGKTIEFPPVVKAYLYKLEQETSVNAK